jgi:pyruvate,orthophosphate dikinase
MDAIILRQVDIKGRVFEPDLAVATGMAPAEVARGCQRLAAAGCLEPGPMGWRLTDAGRTRARELLSAERTRLDTAAIRLLYDEFTVVDASLKQIITSWQRAPATGGPGIASRIEEFHQEADELISRFARHVPRLDVYRTRLRAAMGHILTGNRDYVARPTIDSYHTIWFELHEDLLGIAGANRH